MTRLSDQLQQVAEAARNAGLSLEIEAGREANLAIENAKNAYAESLTLTMDRVDKSAMDTLNQLQSMINDISNNTFGSLDALSLRAQQIVNSLPFRKHEPQLTSVRPQFVVPSQQVYPAVLTMQGNFEFAAKDKFTPTFNFGGQKFAPSENTTQSLKVIVPVTNLFPGAANPQKFSYVVGNLTVPWQDGLIVKHRHEDTYRVMIGALPATPGKIVFRCMTSHTETRTQAFVSSKFYQSSGSDGANDDHKDVPYDVVPHSGWHVVRNTSSFNTKPGTEGDWGKTFVSDAGDHVTYRVTTIHHGIGTAGRVRFTITFTESQDYQVPDNKDENISLNWGDSVGRSCPGSWKILFDAFDGSHTEFPPLTSTTPFLRVSTNGNSVSIGTSDPKTLIWP